MRGNQTTLTVLVFVAAMAFSARAAAGEAAAGIGALRPGDMFSGAPAVREPGPSFPLPGTFGAQSSDEGGGLQDWVWKYELGAGAYASLSGTYLWWMDRTLNFDTGAFRLDDSDGLTGEIGIRINRFLSLQGSLSWFPDMYQGTATGPNRKDQDGWMGGPAVLFHWPLWRLLPFVGVGGGAFERPERDGTDLGPMVFAEGGIRFFLNDYVAITADVKYVWVFLEDEADEETAGAFVGSIGLMLNLPLGF
jgi:hypothetical protein